ncbi:hypothetical protein CesoFtcFv8_018493 [Champsocephalus esox]|uniref:Uncharacterized protein n=1 Tax=Champsocephalus esox TaxID=159716 RepID=A0AAN8BH65_9TELE|nr:hypothetical protein CesoFtcFv8_018493 [Champsocephalus esox]
MSCQEPQGASYCSGPASQRQSQSLAVCSSIILLRFFRRLVLPLHLSSSSCATALSTQPVSPSLMRAPFSLRANSRRPSPPSVCLLLLLLSHTCNERLLCACM